MTDRLSNGFICIPADRGTAVLTFATEGEEMVIGLRAPGLGHSEVRIGIELGRELRDRYAETFANALVAKTARVQAEKDEARERRLAAAEAATAEF